MLISEGTVGGLIIIGACVGLGVAVGQAIFEGGTSLAGSTVDELGGDPTSHYIKERILSHEPTFYERYSKYLKPA